MTGKMSLSRVNSVPSVDSDSSARRPGDEKFDDSRQDRQDREDREGKEVEAVMKQMHGLWDTW